MAICEKCWGLARLMQEGVDVRDQPTIYEELIRHHNAECEGCEEHAHGAFAHQEETAE